ncbi:protein STICHEL-like 1 [Nymphaea colorata]|nr:protein STICHEL-like 1 [Nymphaea colorata]
MERGRHSVDLPISRTLVALRRVRSLRDPTTNSMSRISAFTSNLDWETQSCNAGWNGVGKESHFDEGDRECRLRSVEALFEGDGRRRIDGAHQVGTSTAARISRNGSLRRQVDAESNASVSSHEGRRDDKVLVQENRLKYNKEFNVRSKKLEAKELKEILYSNNDTGSCSTALRSNLGSPCYSLDQEVCHSPSLSALENYPSDPRRLECNRMVNALDGLAEEVKHVSSQCSPLSECQSNGFEQRKVRMDYSKHVKPWGHSEEDFECEDELACCCSTRTMRFSNRFFPHLCRCGLPSNQVRCSRRKSSKLYKSNNINFHKASMSDNSSPSVPLLRSTGEDIRHLRAECINGCFCRHENLAFEDADDRCSVQHSEGTRASTYQNQETSLCSVDDAKCLSQKFRPKSFDDLVGQNLVVQSLKNAVLKGKVAPFYLFEGPHGTGKTSTARVFSTALNCLSTEDLRPCGFCLECIAFLSGQSVDIKEIDFGRAKHMFMLKSLVKHATIHSPATSRYSIFILNECHLLQGELWASLLKCMEKLPRYVVFIFITADPDKLPRAALSRCQRYHFSKIKPKEILSRLCRLCVQENMDFDKSALEYVAGKSNGSLQDAEAMLEQLTLLGQRITVPLVLELTGVISDDELFDLLDMALSADTCNTVRRARELMRSRVDPMALVSQLANLIMDILAGWRQWRISGISRKFFKSHSLTEVELQRLRHSLKILSEAEKQLRMSKNQTTWLTVALLQFGNMEPSLPLNLDNPWASQGSPELRDDNFSCASFPVDSSRNSLVHVMDIHEPYWLELQNDKSGTLDAVWRKTLANLQSRTLKDFLEREGQLSSLCIDKGLGIAELQFRHPEQVLRAEKSQKHIKNSLRGVLGCDMEVRINLIPVSYPESSVEVQQSYRSKPGNKGPSANENYLNSPLSHQQPKTSRRKHKSKLSEVNVCHFFPCMRKQDSKNMQEVALHPKEIYSPDNLGRNAAVEDAAKNQKIGNGDAASVCVLENACLKQVKHRDFQYQALATPKIHKSCFPVVIRFRRRLHASDNVQTVDLKTNVHEELEHSDPREASFKAYICTDDSCVSSSNPCSQSTFNNKFNNQDKSSKCSRTAFKFHCWKAPKFCIKKIWKKRRQRQWKSRLIRWVLHCTAED